MSLMDFKIICSIGSIIFIQSCWYISSTRKIWKRIYCVSFHTHTIGLIPIMISHRVIGRHLRYVTSPVCMTSSFKHSSTDIHVHASSPSNSMWPSSIHIIIIIQVLYGTHINLYRCSRHLYYYYPGFSPGNLVAHSAFEGRNSCRVPIYYIWVERENCG